MYWDIRKNGRREFEKIESEELNQINSNYKSGILLISEAYSQVLHLKEKLLPKQQEDDFLKSNIVAIEKLKASFKRDRKKESDEAIHLDYKRILTLLGKDSIINIDIIELKKRIINSNLAPYTQNRVILFTNKLLKFVNRNEKINKIDADFETKFLTEEDLELLLPSLSKIDQSITRIFFYTGLRLGELFGIKNPQNKYNKESGELKIIMQLKEDLYYDTLKRNSRRTVKISNIIKKDFESFLELNEEFLKKYRNKFSKHLLKASRATFKEDTKHISTHDLRHSFAMHCLQRNISISHIAKLLGNSVSVCERHYTSGVNTTNFLNEFEKQLTKKAS